MIRRISKLTLLIATAAVLPIHTHADGGDTGPTTSESLMQIFDVAEEKAKGGIPTEATKPQKQVQLKEGSNEKRSSDELIFALAHKVDELREKTVINAAVNVATQKPRLAKPIGSKTVYSFKEGDIYEIRTGLDRVTDITLQAGESLTNAPVSGDTVRWTLGIVKSGAASRERTHIILKPLDTGLETNIVLTTDKRVYHIRALSGDWYMPTVSWRYPAEEARRLQASIARKKRVEPLTVPPEQLNFNYKIDSDDEPWSPSRVFDDGQKTYIQMPKQMVVTEAPALFIMEDSEPMLVNYRVKGDFYVVDRIFQHAQLRAGTKSRVDIYDRRFRKNFLERLFD